MCVSSGNGADVPLAGLVGLGYSSRLSLSSPFLTSSPSFGACWGSIEDTREPGGRLALPMAREHR